MVVTVPTSSAAKRGSKLSLTFASSITAFFSVLLSLFMGDGGLFDNATETQFERGKVSRDTPRNLVTPAGQFNAGDQSRHFLVAYCQMCTQQFTDNALDFKLNRGG